MLLSQVHPPSLLSMMAAPGVVVLTQAERVQLAAPPVSVMGLLTTTEPFPERWTALPNSPPDTMVASPVSVPFMEGPPVPVLMTVEPETWSKEYSVTGWMATAAAPAAGFRASVPASMTVGPV